LTRNRFRIFFWKVIGLWQSLFIVLKLSKCNWILTLNYVLGYYQEHRSTGVYQISLQYLTERPSMTWANKVSWNMTGIQVHAALGLCNIINFLLIKNTGKWGLWPYPSLICILVVLARLKTDSNYILNILSTINFFLHPCDLKEWFYCASL
jgi:hypothetical protein